MSCFLLSTLAGQFIDSSSANELPTGMPPFEDSACSRPTQSADEAASWVETLPAAFRPSTPLALAGSPPLSASLQGVFGPTASTYVRPSASHGLDGDSWLPRQTTQSTYQLGHDLDVGVNMMQNFAPSTPCSTPFASDVGLQLSPQSTTTISDISSASIATDSTVVNPLSPGLGSVSVPSPHSPPGFVAMADWDVIEWDELGSFVLSASTETSILSHTQSTPVVDENIPTKAIQSPAPSQSLAAIKGNSASATTPASTSRVKKGNSRQPHSLAPTYWSRSWLKVQKDKKIDWSKLHDGVKFKCPWCAYVSDSKRSNKMDHMYKHAPDQLQPPRLSCSCGKTFAQRRSLQRHQRKIHGNTA
ncbi:hypothetical protein V8E36_005840 [Tilletia maclaganii]